MKIIFFIGAICSILFMSSCYTARIAHGNLTTESPVVQVNSKKHHALVYGLIPLNKGYNAKDYVGDRENYITVYQQTLVDGLLGSLTFGVYTPGTTFFYVSVHEVSSED